MVGLAILGLAGAPKIAFLGRFYSFNPKVHTHYNIYLSDATGRSRRTIFEGAKRGFMTNPFWVSRDRILWLADPPKENSPTQIWTYSLKQSHPHLITKVHFAAEQPYANGPYNGRNVHNGWLLSDGTSGMIDVKSGKWVRIPKVPIDPEEIFPTKENKVFVNSTRGPYLFEVEKGKGDQELSPFSARRGATIHSLPSPSNLWFIRAIKSKADGNIYCEAVFLEHENHYIVSRFNWKTGKLDQVIPECAQYEFVPGRRWNSWTGHRDTTDLAGPMVWTHDLWLGDTKTGKARQLFSTEVKDIGVASIQPEK